LALSEKRLVIAIDGPAASGKSTTAKLVAAKLGYLHVDTGAMYRAITSKVLVSGLGLDDIDAISKLVATTRVELKRNGNTLNVMLDGVDVTERIRTAEVTRAVSMVSSIASVREVMVREQRRLNQGGGIVLEGRDIGTVVFPQADLKIFMVAGIEARAHRRQKELVEQGITSSFDSLKKEIEERDRLDSTRSQSPLRRAPDAIELDTSNMTIDEQVDFVLNEVRKITKQARQE
jgi:cytidylate kinase